MSFAGVPRGSERADLIAYLNSQVGQPGAAAEGRGSAGAAPKARRSVSRRSRGSARLRISATIRAVRRGGE